MVPGSQEWEVVHLRLPLGWLSYARLPKKIQGTGVAADPRWNWGAHSNWFCPVAARIIIGRP